jgi:hypothetical protein
MKDTKHHQIGVSILKPKSAAISNTWHENIQAQKLMLQGSS